jgi:hypothetical protein
VNRSLISLLDAQRVTVSKRAMEMPDLTQFGMIPGEIAREDTDQWASIGVRFWSLGSNRQHPLRGDRPIQQLRQAFETFDARSLHLVTWLHDIGRPQTSEASLVKLINRLEYTTIADSALNELVLRQQIRAKLVAEPGLSFEQLNEWIYAEVFHTPKSDAWLGLAPRTDFTGLPGDGLGYRLPSR